MPPYNPGPSTYSVLSLLSFRQGGPGLSPAGGFSSSLVSQQHRVRGLPTGKHSPGFRLKQQSGTEKGCGISSVFPQSPPQPPI